MIEVPRAAVVADLLAEEAEFFSFGTNDLTQTALGISRDDATHFLPAYVELGLMEKDPFASLDKAGVEPIIEMAIEKGRATRSDLKLGICGEHGVTRHLSKHFMPWVLIMFRAHPFVCPSPDWLPRNGDKTKNNVFCSSFWS